MRLLSHARHTDATKKWPDVGDIWTGKKTVSYYVKCMADEPFLTSSIELQYNTNVRVAQVCV